MRWYTSTSDWDCTCDCVAHLSVGILKFLSSYKQANGNVVAAFLPALVRSLDLGRRWESSSCDPYILSPTRQAYVCSVEHIDRTRFRLVLFQYIIEAVRETALSREAVALLVVDPGVLIQLLNCRTLTLGRGYTCNLVSI